MKKLLLAVIILLSAGFVYDACKHQQPGTLESYDMAVKECWLWCGVRTLLEGELTVSDQGVWRLNSNYGDIALPPLPYAKNCVGEHVRTYGVVRRLPFESEPEFTEIETVVADDDESELMIKRCLN